MRRYDGDDYQPSRDNVRLDPQYERIFTYMRSGEWHTLDEIERATKAPAASVSAQLRHMRKERFGSHTVNKRYRGNGLYEYRLIVNVGEEKQLSLV